MDALGSKAYVDAGFPNRMKKYLQIGDAVTHPASEHSLVNLL